MIRWIPVMLVSLCFVSAVAAAPSQKDNAKPAEAPRAEKPDEVSLEENDQFNLTRDTDVRLDGEPIAYDDVPDSAIIMKMEVAPDRRTIVRVFFRSRK